MDVDGANGYEGYVVGASLATGDPVWEYQTDVNAQGHVLDDGCGSVWSSGTVLPALGLVVFGTADCDFANTHPLAESMIALHISDGNLAWQYKPARPDPQCDWDFGATPNAGVDATGKALFLGEGSKDGTYYSIDPATGIAAVEDQRRLRWVLRRVHRLHRLRRPPRLRRHRHRRLRALRAQQLQAEAVRSDQPPRHVVARADRRRLRRRARGR